MELWISAIAAYGIALFLFLSAQGAGANMVQCMLSNDFETAWTSSNTPAGGIPASGGWSKLVMSNNTQWVRATNGINGYPPKHRTNAWVNSVTGTSNYFARFGAGSYGNVTRLYTPVMDFSHCYYATMTFWHIQVPWPADQDYLRVLYTTNATPVNMYSNTLSRYAGWTTLAYYSVGVTSWTERTLAITNFNFSSNVVVAFEGIGEYAYGVCVDDLMINAVTAIATYVRVAYTSLWQDFETAWTASNTPAGGYPASGWSKLIMSNNTDWVRRTNGINGNPPKHRTNAWVNATTGTSNWFARFGAGSYGNVTRLYTPVLDFSGYVSATMTFWHIQVPWPADQDYLRVLYTTNANRDAFTNRYDIYKQWQTLAYYTAAQTSWVERTLVITNFSTNVAVAFQGIGEYAYGTCIDDLRIVCQSNVSHPFIWVQRTNLLQDFETAWTASNTPAGGIPASGGWSKLIMSNNTDWVRATNGINGNPPKHRTNAWVNATTGTSNYFARFGAGSYGNVTRLYTPVMDLSRSSGSATMTFWHIQVPWPADQDYLRVLVATNASRDAFTNRYDIYKHWQTLAYYTASQTSWVERTLIITNFSTNMAVAFQGIGEYAYGTCIDDLKIMSWEQCLGLIGLSTASLSYSSTYGGANPSPKTFVIANTGVEEFAWTNTVSYSAGAVGWFTPSVFTGSLAFSGTVTVTGAVDTAGLNAGTYRATNTISAPYANNSPQVLVATLTVDKAGQTITFPAIGDQWTTSKVGLAATADSGLVVSFTTNSGPAAIADGTNLSFSGAGLVSIVASQPGNTNWNPAPNVTNTFNVTKAEAGVHLQNMSQAFDGSPRIVTATTMPVGLTVDITYDSGATPPTNAGSYAVTGTVSDVMYRGSAVDTLAVSKGSAGVYLMSLTQVYSGGAKYATVTTMPAGLTVEFTYNGSATAPSNAGNYAVTGTVSALNYEGEATATLTILQQSQTITFPAIGDQVTTGKAGLAATADSGLEVSFAVGSGPGSIAEDTNLTFTGAGLVSIVASQPGDGNWDPAVNVTNTFNVTKAEAQVYLHSLSQTYDGTAKSVIATTDPAGLTVDFTYDGSATAPTAAGSYTVTGAVNNVMYQGAQTGTLVIGKADQAIASFLPTNGSVFAESDTAGLSATASSGLAVSFVTNAGPATIDGGTNLSFTGGGMVRIVSAQSGDANWNPAPNVTNEFRIYGLYELTIVSAHGTASPVAAVYTNLEDTVLTNRVTAPDAAGGTQTVCAGWAMTGNEPQSGGATSLVMTVTNDAVLTWLWQTNYWLDTEAEPHGSVNVGDGWQAFGVTTQITATADSYYHFANWTGDASSGVNPLDLLIDTPKAVTANFAQNMTTSAPVPVPEEWMAEYGLTDFEVDVNADPDDDGQKTWEEYLGAMTDPTNASSFFRTEVGQGSLLISWPSASGRLYDVEAVLGMPGFDWADTEWINQSATPPMNTVTNPSSAMTNFMQFFRTRARME